MNYWCGTMQEQGEYKLVLLPGWGFDRQVFSGLADVLKEQYKRQIKILDLPGYDERKKITTHSVLDATIEPLLPMLTANTVLIGWSLGGMAAIRMAVKSMHSVSSVLLLASSPCFVNKQDWPHGIDKWQIDRMLEQLQTAAGLHKVLRDFSTIVAMGDVSPKETAARLNKLVTADDADRKRLLQGLDILGNSDLRCDLGRLTCRVIMLLAENDRLIARTTGAATRALCPTLELDFIPRVGHAPFISELHKTAAALNRHLD